MIKLINYNKYNLFQAKNKLLGETKWLIIISILFTCYLEVYSKNIDWKSIKYGFFYDIATVNVNANISDFPEIKLYPHSINNVSSLGDYYGLFLTVPIKDSLDLLFNAGLRVAFINNVSIFYFDEYNIGNGQIYTTKIKNTFEWISIAPIIQKELAFGINGNFGLQINFPIIAEGIFNDNLRHTHLYPKKTINPRLQLGLSYPIPLYKHSSIMIVPEINALFSLNNDVGGNFNGKWTSNYFTIGMALQYDKENYSFKEIIKEYEYTPVVIDTVRRIANSVEEYHKVGTIIADSTIWKISDSLTVVNYNYKRTDTLYFASSKIFEINDTKLIAINDTNSSVVNNNFKIEINEYYKNIQEIPILPYIFFDHNSYTLKDKYQCKINNESEFQITTKNNNPNLIMETYYDILNIIGKRLQEHPNWNIKLVGCNDGFSTEEKNNIQLSEARANAVREYLHNIYNIEYHRMSIVAQGLPNKPSLIETEIYKQEENRRVEIVSNNDSLLLPVTNISIQKQTNYNTILLYSYITTNTEIKQYVIKLEFDDKVISISNYSYPAIIDGILNIEENIPLNYDFINSNGKYKLTLLITNNSNQSKTYNIEIPVIYNNIETLENNNSINKNIKTNYNYLVLFDLKASDINDKQQIQMLNNIKNILSETDKNYNCSLMGYTDINGDNNFNQKLSQKRTESIKNILNVDNIVMNTADNNYLFDNYTPEGRFYSRSVQIEIE